MLNSHLFSQNINEKTWNSVNFDLIFLRLDFISQITIKKSLSREILIKYIQEGEFKENILLQTTDTNRELYIKEIVSPIFKRHNDKLSVHKTIANTIEVLIPIDFKTIIKAKSCNVNLMGGFTDINLEIDDGNINLNQKIIQGKIKSVSGNIHCVNSNSKLLVSSKSGLIYGLYNSSIKPNLIVETTKPPKTPIIFPMKTKNGTAIIDANSRVEIKYCIGLVDNVSNASI